MHAVILGLHFDKKMNLSKKVHQINEAKLICKGKETTLNPNAAEFIPVALKSPGNSSVMDATTKFGTFGTPGKVVLDRSESSISNNSDEEARQYWSRQLPDDITPDFKVVGENESQGLEYLSLVGMSLHDTTEQLRVTTHTGTRLVLNEQQESAPHHINGNNFIEKMGYSISTYGEDSDACFMHLPCKPWDKQIVNNGHLIRNSMGAASFNGDSRHGYISDMFSEHEFVDENEINHLDSLAAQFPGFAAESLADVYYANQCDMNLTVEMLTQLELQVDGGFDQNLNSKTLLAPNLSALDFPALPASDSHHGLQKFAGDDLQQSVNPYRASGGEDWLMFKSGSSNPSKGATDFASAVKKLASQDSGIWKYDKQSSADGSIGSSKSSHVLTSSCNNGHGRAVYADRLRNRGSVRAPVWVATGEAVASMYSELREEARDHARLRNAYFEQATQAYLIGNKALAKELSAKGQLHNMHMKAAHGKAQESIYHQRNPGGPQVKGNGKGQERMIDLHGLHVSEAIHVLKLELGVLRSAAKSASQPLQIYICVGTGHHTRGSRTPARLPVAVQRHLLEEEGLDYTEPQPGLLRVVIY